MRKGATRPTAEDGEISCTGPPAAPERPSSFVESTTLHSQSITSETADPTTSQSPISTYDELGPKSGPGSHLNFSTYYRYELGPKSGPGSHHTQCSTQATRVLTLARSAPSVSPPHQNHSPAHRNHSPTHTATSARRTRRLQSLTRPQIHPLPSPLRPPMGHAHAADARFAKRLVHA